MGFFIRSKSFINEGFIKDINTDLFDNYSPQLEWYNKPSGTQSFAIFVEDIMPFFNMSHWIIYNIPEHFTNLEENIPKVKFLSDGIKQGLNWKLQYGYTGPNPFFGTHKYRFKIYALDKIIKKNFSLTITTFKFLISGNILGESEIIGYYSKNRHEQNRIS